jgi:hypothetical protein
MDIKVVKHTLYPVSYLTNTGEQMDVVWQHDPSKHSKDEYFVGEAFTVELIHPVTMGEEAKQAKIAELEKELAILKEKANA